MHRVERMCEQGRVDNACFDAVQLHLEAALRGRAARRARAVVRRMLPSVITTPRWSDPGQFFEELALDLAVGEPAVGCRRVALGHLRGRPVPQARQELLRVMTSLVDRRRLPPTVVDGRAFRHAVIELASEAQDAARDRTVLMLYGAENLPVEVGEDFLWAWNEAARCVAYELQVSLVVAGASGASWMRASSFPALELSDFGEEEVVGELVRRFGVPADELEHAATISGGVPAVIDAVGPLAVTGLEREPEHVLGRMGRLGDEIRGAVDIACMDPRMGSRLSHLAESGSDDRDDADVALVDAGLVRFASGGRTAALRLPLVRALV